MAEHLLVYPTEEMTPEEAQRLRDWMETLPSDDSVMCLLHHEDTTRLIRLRLHDQ